MLPTGRRGPDFIIGGAPRSATTWLSRLADAHPDIAMAKPTRPEPKFFLIDEIYERGLEYYYRTWFDPLPPGRVLGEKSTNYLENLNVAERIRQCVPDVKLVFIVRNPVDRAYSNFLWSTENGLESLDFVAALDQEEGRGTPDELRYARPFAYFSRGLYADLLAPFFDRFPRERILVLRTEDVATNPQAVAKEFFGFVGVPPNSELAESIGIVNETSSPEPVLEPFQRARLQERYREPNERLRVLLQLAAPLW